MCLIEEHTPWETRAELYISIFKGTVRRHLRLSHLPIVLWDYCMERHALVHNAVTRPLF